MLRVLQKRVTQSLRVQCSRMMSDSVTGTPAASFDEEDNEVSRKLTERCLNRATLMGRVGREPEQRGSSEHPCLIFPLATNLTFRRADGERIVKTDWHRVAVFKPSLRSSVEGRIEKGDRLLVEGPISYVRYTDKDKRNINVASISAERIVFLTPKQRPDPADEIEETD